LHWDFRDAQPYTPGDEQDLNIERKSHYFLPREYGWNNLAAKHFEPTLGVFDAPDG
jgi:hypothetical protein